MEMRIKSKISKVESDRYTHLAMFAWPEHLQSQLSSEHFASPIFMAVTHVSTTLSIVRTDHYHGESLGILLLVSALAIGHCT
jgi:hypothetical protein